ncbi:MAG TPA: NAD-dependent succinate-semialdehyde dehydrogenase [Opitutaceae bacterium]|jgi:succinate-semialdehyde dehydrogenase/glutarate-semialdehyde dehydrogenase
MNFVSLNPATGRKLRSYRASTAIELDRALSAAVAAQRAWRLESVAFRTRSLKQLGRTLLAHLPGWAALITAEMGKPLAQSRSELEKCAALCDFFAKRSANFLADERPPGAPANCHVSFEPLGVILAIMPWNFPFWQVMRAAVPAIAGGNTVILKHSPNVSGCAFALQELFAAALPAHVFQTLLLPNERVPQVLADHRIQGVTLTGSTRAGRTVGEIAGREMKKAVFELGGSDAYIVLADADLDHAAEVCASARLINSGQSCVCAKRFIVVSSVRREFESRFVARMASRTVGDPTEAATDVGPLARRDLRDHLDQQVQASVKRGAKVLLGGKFIPGPGNYYAPTVLTGVAPGMPAHNEELFGPVAAVISVRDETAALAAANGSSYGLGAAIFTRNTKQGRLLARRLEAGAVFINDFVRSDPSLPFGGVKQSGHGRELSAFGLREFLNIKTICVTKA